VFEELRRGLVFNGHNHLYERSARSVRTVVGEGAGVVYSRPYRRRRADIR